MQFNLKLVCHEYNRLFLKSAAYTVIENVITDVTVYGTQGVVQ